MLAKYDGRCAICDEPIHADEDPIVYLEEEGEWVHLECGIASAEEDE